MTDHEPAWDDLRADGRVVVDAPARKLAVYSNKYGDVVLMSLEDGSVHHASVSPNEVTALLRELMRASGEAKAIGQELNAEYVTHQAVEKARGAL